MSNKKTYVLDTNVLLSDSNSLFSFEEHDVVIPMAVLEELDRQKTRMDEVGRNGRHVSKALDDMRQNGQSLTSGVTLPGGGTIRIASVNSEEFIGQLPTELSITKVDNMIIALMINLKRTCTDSEPILVSRDINVRIKCDGLGIKCEDYKKIKIATDASQLYKGVITLDSFTESQLDEFYLHGSLPLHLSEEEAKDLYPNQIVVIKCLDVFGNTVKSAISKLVFTPSMKLVSLKKYDSVFGLKPRNKEQQFALDLLFDPEIKLLTLIGPSGTGKTLLALAAALEQLRGVGTASDNQRYDKLVVTKPIQPVGKDIGFLPGSLTEKMEPWIAPIRDNLNFLMNNKGSFVSSRRGKKQQSQTDEYGKPTQDDGTYLSLMQEKGIIEIEAITFIRGRSIPNAFIVIDEAQNLSMHELKTIVTRVGDNTKIILTGDIEQIDNVHVDAYTNGLTYAVERFKEFPISGHVTLLKGERSQLATIASKIL